MRVWFHLNRELKDTYKTCVKFDIYFVKFVQHCLVLEFHPALKEEICTFLKKNEDGMTISLCNLHPAINQSNHPRQSSTYS